MSKKKKKGIRKFTTVLWFYGNIELEWIATNKKKGAGECKITFDQNSLQNSSLNKKMKQVLSGL